MVLFTGIMTSTKHVHILEEGLLPFISDYRVSSQEFGVVQPYQEFILLWVKLGELVHTSHRPIAKMGSGEGRS